MLTDWNQVRANYLRQRKEDRMSLCSYEEVAYWRRRARGWRMMFFLLLAIMLWAVRR